jgi:hypothetical protein
MADAVFPVFISRVIQQFRRGHVTVAVEASNEIARLDTMDWGSEN